MRNKYIALILVLLFAASCRNSDKENITLLHQAQEVIDENPDSSLLLLNRIDDAEHKLNKADYMLFLITRVDAMNKAYIPLDSVDFMTDVLDYYKKEGSPYEVAKAYYLLGSVYRDKGDARKALSYFKESAAVEFSEYTPEDYLLISHAYGQMAWLFEDMHYTRQSLNMRDKRIEYALKAGDTIVAVQSYDYKAGLYLTMGQPDSAMYVSKKAYSILKQKGYDDIAAGILPTQINYYLGTDSLEQARKAIDEYVTNSGLVDPVRREMKSPDLVSFYNDWALYYQKTNRPDSALYFYQKSMQSPDNENLRRTFRGLISLYSSLQQTDSVYKYTHLYTNLIDSLYLANSNSELARIESLYNYSESQEKALQKSREADNLRTTIYLILFFALVLSLLVYRYIRKQREHKKYELMSVNAKYSEALAKYGRAREEIKSLNTDISEYKSQKTAELERLKDILSSYQDNVNPELWNVEQTLMEHDTVTQLHHDAARARTASDSQWNDLDSVVRKLLPDFYAALDARRDNLTYKEFRLCMLTRLNFIPTEIATLMSVSKQCITNFRASSNKKLFNETGSRTFDSNIHNLKLN